MNASVRRGPADAGVSQANAMSDEISNKRPYIIELLQLLASEEEQLAYERNVPHVNITVELRCMWFDDQYHPDDAVFVSCFTTDELSALAEFHRFYDERKSDVSLPQMKQLPGSYWERSMLG